MWNYFRLENEHLNNVGKFRAVRDISIGPMSTGDNGGLKATMCFVDQLDDDDGDDDEDELDELKYQRRNFYSHAPRVPVSKNCLYCYNVTQRIEKMGAIQIYNM